MSILAFMVIGLVVGLFARVVIPANQKLGLIAVCLIAMLGAMVGGGVFGSLFDRNGRPFELNAMDIVLGLVTSVLFVIVVGVANSRRAHA